MGFFQSQTNSSKKGFFQKGESPSSSFLGKINDLALKATDTVNPFKGINAYRLLTGQPSEGAKKVFESGVPGTRFLSTLAEQQSLVPREYAPPPTNLFQKGEVALGGAAGQIPAFLTGSMFAKAALKVPTVAKAVTKAGQIPKIGKFVEPVVREGLTGLGYGATRPAEDFGARAKATLESGAFFAPFGAASKIGGPVFKSLLPPKLAPQAIPSAVKKAAVVGGGTAAIAGGEEYLADTDEDTKNKFLQALMAGATAAPLAILGGTKVKGGTKALAEALAKEAKVISKTQKVTQIFSNNDSELSLKLAREKLSGLEHEQFAQQSQQINNQYGAKTVVHTNLLGDTKSYGTENSIRQDIVTTPEVSRVIAAEKGLAGNQLTVLNFVHDPVENHVLIDFELPKKLTLSQARSILNKAGLDYRSIDEKTNRIVVFADNPRTVDIINNLTAKYGTSSTKNIQKGKGEFIGSDASRGDARRIFSEIRLQGQNAARGSNANYRIPQTSQVSDEATTAKFYGDTTRQARPVFERNFRPERRGFESVGERDVRSIGIIEPTRPGVIPEQLGVPSETIPATEPVIPSEKPQKFIQTVKSPRVPTKQQINKATGVKKPETKVVTTEEKLLKGKFQQQAKGAEVGYKAGVQETRNKIIDTLRRKFEDQVSGPARVEITERAGKISKVEKAGLKQQFQTERFKTDMVKRFTAKVKQQIKDYAIQTLPPKVRGRMLSAVANAKTQKDLTHSFFRIDNIAARVERSGAVEQLKKDLVEASKSSMIAVSYRNLIKDTILDITLKNYGKRTLTRLEETKAFIERELAAGNNVEMPKRVVEALEILTKKPLQEISNRELLDMITKIQSLKKYGKFAETSRKINLKNDIAQVVDELREVKTSPLKAKELERAGIGETLSWKSGLKNFIRRARNTARMTDLAITPMDVVFDLLDGSKRYSGTLFRHFKARIDTSYGRYLNQSTEVTDRFVELNKELKLKKQNFERIGVHAARVQDGGIKKLLDTGLSSEASFNEAMKKQGLSKEKMSREEWLKKAREFKMEQINKVQLTSAEEQMYQFMRKELEDIKPFIDDTMANVYNKEVGKVKEYFPFVTNFKAMDESAIYERFGHGQIKDFQYAMGKKKTPSQKFTKERTLGDQMLNLDADYVFLNHINNASYLINMGRDLKVLQESMKHPEMEGKLGDVGFKLVNEWLNVVATAGKSGNVIPWADVLRKNLGAAVLGFRLSSAIVQHTAIYDGASQIGFRWTNEGLKRMIDGNFRKFIKKAIPEFGQRGGDDPFIAELKNGNAFSKAQYAALGPLRKLDVWVAGATASGAYLKKLNELGIKFDPNVVNKEAAAYASLVLRRTQASAFPKDLPLSLSKGVGLTGNKSLNKAFFTFQTFLLNRFSLIRHDIIGLGIKEKDPIKASKMASWILLATLGAAGTGLATKKLFNVITGKEPTKAEEENQLRNRLISEAVQTVPFLGQLYSGIYYDSFPVPAISVAGQVLKGSRAVFTGKKPQTKLKGAVKAAEGIGGLLGVPGSSQGLDIISDLISGGGPDTGNFFNQFQESSGGNFFGGGKTQTGGSSGGKFFQK